MKKFLLLFSFVIPLIFGGTSITQSKEIQLNNNVQTCEHPSKSIVRVLNNYDIFKSNRFVYKKDNVYNYIITSSNIVNETNNYKILYQDGSVKNALILGHDKYNGIAVIRTEKEENSMPVCFANSTYVYKGQANYAYGYHNISNQFFIKTTLSQIGDLYSKDGYINIYKNIVEIDGDDSLNGTGIFDDMNRLTGVVTNYLKDFEGASFITESNKLIKIADSIEKTGKYNINYIKYNLEDYNGLSSVIKESYGVNSKVTKGVVITTFKPFNYLFGGLNQGMVIVAVNGIEIKNKYELDSQLSRYEKNDNVCLKVIKKNGKEAFYHVKV